VIAAGGFRDGRGLVAALAASAAGDRVRTASTMKASGIGACPC
jgi:NAD(P)H-dependent flavin oxidoreductase YrpB (nitropropane dioxygenase family)